MERFKAGLVIFGNHQKEGIDYFETCSPVVKPTIVRLVHTIVVSLRWPINQLDVNNVFLRGFLHEEVYMRQLLGFVHPSKPTYLSSS